MKIAVLYICTGKYRVFWDDFYKSCEKFFLQGYAKHYFIFTDATDIMQDNNITVIPKGCYGFPLDSLFRFDMFLEIEDKVAEFDYCFFFNANMLFVDKVDSEIFPYENYKGIICVTHPRGYKYRNYPSLFTYERNKQSLAYVPKERKKYNYFMGGFNGGSIQEYYGLVKTCSKNIHADYSRGLIAVFHDESHLNKYCCDHSKLIYTLPVSYGFPENATFPFQPKVIIRDKTVFSEYFDKHSDESILKKIKRYLLVFYRGLTW